MAEMVLALEQTASRRADLSEETLGLDDAELCRRLREGDVGALELLYDRYAGTALGIAYRLVGDRQSAEDVLQESFLQVWRNAGRYDSRQASLKSWLLAIVHHRCIDALRRRAARPQAAWNADAVDYETGFDTWKEVERRLTGASVRRALDQLSPEQREAIELGYFGGFSHAQIAERLGVPLGTVKGRLRLGLGRLRTLLEPSHDAHVPGVLDGVISDRVSGLAGALSAIGQ